MDHWVFCVFLSYVLEMIRGEGIELAGWKR